MKTATIAVAALAAALALAGSALAATTGDLAALGYHVGVASTHDGDACTVYSIEGYGVSTYADSCAADFQATIDQLAYAATHPAPPPPPPTPPPTVAPVDPAAAPPVPQAPAAPSAPAQAPVSATLPDLEGLGYAVGVANSGGGCTTYYFSGHDVQTYASTCDPSWQATLDSLAAHAVAPPPPPLPAYAPRPAAAPASAAAPATAATVDAGTVAADAPSTPRALQAIVGHPVRVTAATRCYAGMRRVACATLARRMAGHRVKVWTRGRVVVRVVVLP